MLENYDSHVASVQSSQTAIDLDTSLSPGDTGTVPDLVAPTAEEMAAPYTSSVPDAQRQDSDIPFPALPEDGLPSSEQTSTKDSMGLPFPMLDDVEIKPGEKSAIDAEPIPFPDEVYPLDALEKTDALPFPDVDDAFVATSSHPADLGNGQMNRSLIPEDVTSDAESVPFPTIPDAAFDSSDTQAVPDMNAAVLPFPEIPVDDTSKAEAPEEVSTANDIPMGNDTSAMNDVPTTDIDLPVQELGIASFPDASQGVSVTPDEMSASFEDSLTREQQQSVPEKQKQQNTSAASVDLEKLLGSSGDSDRCQRCGEVKAQGAIYCTACGCRI
ncbi:MAG: hypothetical protein JXX14_15130 [Deltaproteobacteria bacterium]|nr:hypothetical protein [Deltaproteobacteria bacterium]